MATMDRKNEIRKGALAVAKAIGLNSVSHRTVGDAVGVTSPCIAKYFTAKQLKDAAVDLSVEEKVCSVAVQAIASGRLSFKNLDEGFQADVLLRFTGDDESPTEGKINEN